MSLETSLAFILEEEGGYSDHDPDPGGATNRGVTQSTYDAWRDRRGIPARNVRSIEDDEVRAIYREMYWLPAHCSEWPPAVALVTFDTAVQRGPRRAIMDLQRAVGVREDGMVGPVTRRAVAAQDARGLVERLLLLRGDHYADRVRDKPDQAAFLKGWVRRLLRLTFAAVTTG
jgi:lysozyme family protein